MSQPTILRRVPRVLTPGAAASPVVAAAVRRLAVVFVACALTLAAVLPAVARLPGAVLGAIAQEEAAHLLISEVMTGGASASDEFVELYNPTTAELPLEGLELVYVSATGVTVTRRASWPLGAPSVPARGHHLLANDLGSFSGIGDTLYAGGMAATGGSVALRIQGATTALDAVGWGNAASAWLEGTPAPAPPAGQSIERLPGGSAGSATDSGDNFVDFVVRQVPDPQNAGSPPVPGTPSTGSPSPTPGDPSPDPTFETPSQSPEVSPPPVPSGSASPAPSGSPGTSPAPTLTPATTPAPLTVAAARARPVGSVVTVSAVTLSDSSFTDGGGFIADATGGLAVLLADGSFPRGVTLTITGELDDRYSQRTVRAGSDGLLVGGQASAPAAVSAPSGSIGEAHEGRLARLRGTIVGAPTELASGLAFEVDDGSGPARVLVGPSTGIATTGWEPGAAVEVVGVVSQRDTTGTGVEGYRLLPRDAGDVVSVDRPPQPSASATPPPSGEEPDPTAEPGGEGPPLVSIAQARAAATGEEVRVRGVVTVASGLIDRSTAIIQDPTAAIVLRLGGEVGRLSRGDAVEVVGTRSTKSGMLTLRVSAPPRRLGSSPEPAPRRIATGNAGEALEAQLVVARGAITETARRSSSGSVTFDIDDGSGELRVHLPAALRAERTGLASGAWVEVIGALGQQTSGGQPGSGYRIWPRATAELTILAPATDGEAGAGDDGNDDGDDDDGPGGRSAERGGRALDQLLPGAPGGAPRTAEATLVIGAWPELGVAGVLWDGRHAIGIAPDAAGQQAVAAALDRGGPPREVRVTAPRAVTTTTPLELPVVALPDAASLARGGGRPRAPLTALPADGVVAWVRITGRLDRDGPGLAIAAGERRVLLTVLCRAAPDPGGLQAGDVVEVQGLAAGQRIIGVPCGGVRPAPRLAGLMAEAARVGGPSGSSAPAAAGESGFGLLPILLGASTVAGGGLLAAAAWRTGAFARLMASLAPASLPGAGAEDRSPAGDDEGREPVPRTDMTPVEPAADPGSDPVRRPPTLRVVRLPPHGGE